MINRTEKEIMQNWKGDFAKPIVSVCTITYNHEQYISEAIDSFLMQETDFPFEIVIGEDCSTDGTRKIIEEYKENYPNVIKAIKHTENKGVIKNFYSTIKECKGKYIALCEGDDYWIDEKKLQKQYDVLEQDMGISGVYHKANIVDATNKIIKTIPWKGKTYERLDDFFEDFYQIPTCSVMMRNLFKDHSFYRFRKIFRNAGYILDYLIDTLIIEQGKYIFLDEVMSCYRVIENNDSFSSQKIEKIEIEMLQTRDNIDQYFNFKYHNELLKNKEKIKMSILLKTYKQGGISAFIKKLNKMKIYEIYRLVINVLKYKVLKLNQKNEK